MTLSGGDHGTTATREDSRVSTKSFEIPKRLIWEAWKRVPTVFTKIRERLIKHDAVIEFFNEVVAIAEKKCLLSGEHFSVDGTLIQAWAGHKSFVRKDNDDQDNDGDNPGDFKGSKRSNETHESRTDSDARLFRKGKTASELRYVGHTLTDNRHGLWSTREQHTPTGMPSVKRRRS